MRKPRSNRWALLAPSLALLLAGAVIAGSSGQNSELEPEQDPPGSEDCICPDVYDPVVCTRGSSGGPIIQPNQWQRFSNSCYAGCAGYTRCRPAPEEVR